MRTDFTAKILGWLLPFSLAGGAFLLPIEIGGISFYLLRWIVLFGAFIGFIELIRNFNEVENQIKKFSLVLFIWLAIGLISYSFVLDSAEWKKDIFYLLIGISIFLTLFFIRSRRKMDYFIYGWMGGYICNLAFGFFEMYTGNHFSSGFTDGLSELSPEHYTQFAPAGFFDNPNHYASYLILSFAVFTYYRKSFTDSAYLILLFPAIWQIFYTGSKFAIIALLVWCVYLVIVQRKEWMIKNVNYLRMISFVGIFFLLLFISFNSKVVSLINPSQKAQKELQKVDPDKRPTSDNMRKALFMNGIHFIKSTYGIGIGAGQFSAYIEKDKAPYETNHLSDPHNGIIEIASQYGIIVVLLLFWFYLDLIKNYFRIAQSKERILALCYFITILIVININSSFISSPINWFLLALPVVWFNSTIETQKK